jgi:hypothetical protein
MGRVSFGILLCMAADLAWADTAACTLSFPSVMTAGKRESFSAPQSEAQVQWRKFEGGRFRSSAAVVYSQSAGMVMFQQSGRYEAAVSSSNVPCRKSVKVVEPWVRVSSAGTEASVFVTRFGIAKARALQADFGKLSGFCIGSSCVPVGLKDLKNGPVFLSAPAAGEVILVYRSGQAWTLPAVRVLGLSGVKVVSDGTVVADGSDGSDTAGGSTVSEGTPSSTGWYIDTDKDGIPDDRDTDDDNDGTPDIGDPCPVDDVDVCVPVPALPAITLIGKTQIEVRFNAPTLEGLLLNPVDPNTNYLKGALVCRWKETGGYPSEGWINHDVNRNLHGVVYLLEPSGKPYFGSFTGNCAFRSQEGVENYFNPDKFITNGLTLIR